MISFIVLCFCALIFILMGIGQWRNQNTVTFYSGEEPLHVNPVSEWNHRHGMMWILYGVILGLLGVSTFLVQKQTTFLMMFLICMIVPPVCMVFYHKYLVNKYVVKEEHS